MKSQELDGERRIYLHLFFSPEQALEDEQEFNSRMSEWQEELVGGNRHPDHEKFYSQYFDIKTIPVRGTQVIAREGVIRCQANFFS
ncbi:MAG: hypothetical protein JW902_16755 [Syntrophaceae bacterium]|nr:hypothetical protein [Syntrophaceae bacterium]